MIESSEKPGCECAIGGVHSYVDDVTKMTVTLLHHMNQRGQEGAGVVTIRDDGVIRSHKDSGWARNVFTPSVVSVLSEKDPNIAVGHNRYSVSGNAHAWQPFCEQTTALAHNGNLTNARQILEKLPYEMRHDIQSDSDIVSRRLNVLITLCNGDVLEACRQLGSECEGAYNYIIGTPGKLIAMRDPWGFHPLSIGVNGNYDDPERQTYVVASETSSYVSPLQMKHLRDVYPGEGVVIDNTGVHTFFMDERTGKFPNAQCIFELLYFSSPDAVIFGEHVNTVRTNLGRALAQRDIAEGYEPGIIVPVQQSGIVHAVGYAKEYIEHRTRTSLQDWMNNIGTMDVDAIARDVSSLHIEFGVIRNPYSARVFIDPSDKRLATSGKHRADTNIVGGQRVTLIDDSIVKGNAQETLQFLLREAGAHAVDVRIAAPPIRHPCYWGVDFAERSKLIAALNESGTDIEEHVRDSVRADSVKYLPPLETLRVVLGDARFDMLLQQTTHGFMKQSTLMKSLDDPEIGVIYTMSDFCGSCFHGYSPTNTSGVYEKDI